MLPACGKSTEARPGLFTSRESVWVRRRMNTSCYRVRVCCSPRTRGCGVSRLSHCSQIKFLCCGRCNSLDDGGSTGRGVVCEFGWSWVPVPETVSAVVPEGVGEEAPLRLTVIGGAIAILPFPAPWRINGPFITSSPSRQFTTAEDNCFRIDTGQGLSGAVHQGLGRETGRRARHLGKLPG